MQSLFSYVQIGCRDYQKLSDFYIRALGFAESTQTKWLNGKEGRVLTSPGYASCAPVFGFLPAEKGAQAKINDIGFAHTCFETTDIKAAVGRFISLGGRVVSTFPKPLRQPCVYCADLEGNIVEFHVPFPDGIGFPAIGKTISSILGLRPDKSIRKNDTSFKSSLKFIHVNIISEDWRALCDYYISALGCSEFGPLKDHEGEYKSQVIGIENVHVIGQHILMNGLEKTYPTFEIFTYSIKGRNAPTDERELGINCIGFTADEPNAVADVFVNAGGRIIEATEEFILLGDIQDDRIYLRK